MSCQYGKVVESRHRRIFRMKGGKRHVVGVKEMGYGGRLRTSQAAKRF